MGDGVEGHGYLPVALSGTRQFFLFRRAIRYLPKKNPKKGKITTSYLQSSSLRRYRCYGGVLQKLRRAEEDAHHVLSDVLVHKPVHRVQYARARGARRLRRVTASRIALRRTTRRTVPVVTREMRAIRVDALPVESMSASGDLRELLGVAHLETHAAFERFELRLQMVRLASVSTTPTAVAPHAALAGFTGANHEGRAEVRTTTIELHGKAHRFVGLLRQFFSRSMPFMRLVRFLDRALRPLAE